MKEHQSGSILRHPISDYGERRRRASVPIGLSRQKLAIHHLSAAN
jgi:hypothetical protein